MTQIRRKVSIGGLSKHELLERLASAGVEINSIGLQLFAQESFRTLEVPVVVEAVQITVAELGLPDGGVFAQVIRAAEERALALCPLELGPHLRLALLDQAEGAQGFERRQHTAPPGAITVVSQPLPEDGEEFRGFYLRRIEGTLWLRGYKSWSGHLWQPEDILLFTSARNASPTPRSGRAPTAGRQARLS